MKQYCTTKQWELITKLQSQFVDIKSMTLKSIIEYEIKKIKKTSGMPINIIDIASGTSLNINHAFSKMTKTENLNYYAIDLDSNVLQMSKQLSFPPNINTHFVNSNAHQYDYNNANIVICLENTFLSLGNIDQIKELLKKIFSNKDTVLVISIVLWDDKMNLFYQSLAEWNTLPTCNELAIKCSVNTSKNEVQQKVFLKNNQSTDEDYFTHNFIKLNSEQLHTIINDCDLQITDIYNAFTGQRYDNSKNNFDDSNEFIFTIRGLK